MKSINEVKQFIVELLNLFPNKKTDIYHIGKAYYYANYFALKEHGTLVSTHCCVKLDYGPGIDDYKEIIDDLVEEGVVSREKSYFICLTNNTKQYVSFPEIIQESIKKAYVKVKDKSFNQLKDETHNLESYKKASSYTPIDYSDDILSEEEINEARQFLNSIPRFELK